MRVLTVTSLFPNAVSPLLGTFVYQRVAHFAKRERHTVQVVAPVPYFPLWVPMSRWSAFGRVPRKEQIGSLTVYHPRYPQMPKISMLFHGLLIFLGCLRLVCRLHREQKFDCIDAHYVFPDGLAAVLLGKWLGIPVVISARGSDIDLFPSFRLIRPQICWTLRHADGLVAVSRALGQKMLDLGASCVEVIGNGIEAQSFYPVPRDLARVRAHLPQAAKIILSVAALVPCKGHRLLLTAYAEVAKSYSDLLLVLVGGGELRHELTQQIRDLHLEDRVVMAGKIPNNELKFWYSAADVSCLASSREGMPNVLLEALACGTPLVATNVGGVPEVITSSEIGILVEENASALADALNAALQKSWDRKAIAHHGHQRTWDSVAAEVERYLNLVLTQHNGTERRVACSVG